MINWITRYQSILSGLAGGVVSVITVLVTLRFKQSNRMTKAETNIDGIDKRQDRLQDEMDALRKKCDELSDRISQIPRIEDVGNFAQRLKEFVALVDQLKNTISALKVEHQPQTSPLIAIEAASVLKRRQGAKPRIKKEGAARGPKPKSECKTNGPFEIKSVPKPKRLRPRSLKNANTGEPGEK